MPFAVCGTNNGTCVCPVGKFFNASGSCDYLNRTITTEQSDFFVPQIPHLVDTNESRSTFSNVIVIATLFIVLGWVVFTTFLRFMPLRGIWFRLRRFVRWCDYIYSKRHWMVGAAFSLPSAWSMLSTFHSAGHCQALFSWN